MAMTNGHSNGHHLESGAEKKLTTNDGHTLDRQNSGSQIARVSLVIPLRDNVVSLSKALKIFEVCRRNRGSSSFRNCCFVCFFVCLLV